MSRKDERTQVIDAVTAMVTKLFAGEWRRCFDTFDTDSDGLLAVADVIHVLAASAVGNFLSRGTWARGIVAEVDTNGDGKISWDEFDTAFRDHQTGA